MTVLLSETARWVVLLAFGPLALLACEEDTSTGNTLPEAGDVQVAMEASPPPDAGTCPTRGVPTLNLDQQVAAECSGRQMLGWGLPNIWVSTMECGGFLALLVQDGIDTQSLYLYDPSTRSCVELAGGANGQNECLASVSGVPLAPSCTFAIAYGPLYSGPPWGFRDACPEDGGTPADAQTDAPADSPSDAADAAHDL